ncbi:MAG TPA: tryptophan--tRNA ligase [Candidatus Dormibacteraeota bacterium]|nr:tryptophan--tRNA ligase [Candidatus Dormibacteraeota bacterium]
MGERPVVFSGMQPNGALHLGNLLGALRPWVVDQRQFHNFFCVVDLHALSQAHDPSLLAQKTREVAALYIASGIDPELSTLLVQSHVPEHSELAWILGCITPLGWLERMTQFKDKSQRQDGERIGAGLLNYPVLMAADILLYRTNFVPVGEDQRQHLELTRDLAGRFNRLFGETLVIPEARIGQLGSGQRVMALDDPEAKMSKSAAGEAGRVALLDSPDRIRSKVMRAKTDSGAAVDVAHAQAGVANLLDIYRGLTSCSLEDLAVEFHGNGYGQLKAKVADTVVEALLPLQERYHDLMSDPSVIDEILARGANQARQVARATMAQVRASVGLLPSRPSPGE